MDGHEAAKAIRALARPDAHEIPLIAMSADAFEEDISASLASGINAHLIKPINPQELYKTLATFVK
jgi:CheY-like chemotaxis protein